MKKVYFLSSCSTCQRIIKDLQLQDRGFVFQDIKTEKISPTQLDELKKMCGTYEALFSRVALKYKTLAVKPNSEKEYRSLILEEYTFLKRPVIICNDRCFVGNQKTTVAAAESYLKSLD